MAMLQDVAVSGDQDLAPALDLVPCLVEDYWFVMLVIHSSLMW